MHARARRGSLYFSGAVLGQGVRRPPLHQVLSLTLFRHGRDSPAIMRSATNDMAYQRASEDMAGATIMASQSLLSETLMKNQDTLTLDTAGYFGYACWRPRSTAKTCSLLTARISDQSNDFHGESSAIRTLKDHTTVLLMAL